MVTLLDAHSSIAMSYEQYPNLLTDDSGEGYSKAGLLRFFDDPEFQPSKSLQTFMNRSVRGGLVLDDVRGILQNFGSDDPQSSMSELDRTKLIGAIARAKMSSEGKLVWGLKCSNAYASYAEAYPEARFINITRDGRDVAASQMNTGSFNKSAAEVAKGWKATHQKFSEYAEVNPQSTFQVLYEDLVSNPEPVLKRLCDFLGEDWDPGMLNHSDKDLTIFNTNHLSGDRLRVPIDASKIGRWKVELNAEDIEAFEAEAGDLLSELGYK